MIDQQYAKTYLETCAITYAVHIAERMPAELSRAGEALAHAALAYAGTAGNLGAAERFELEQLRRFRDGVTSLRNEFAAGRDFEGKAIVDADAAHHAIESIDALLYFTKLQPPKAPL